MAGGIPGALTPLPPFLDLFIIKGLKLAILDLFILSGKIDLQFGCHRAGPIPF